MKPVASKMPGSPNRFARLLLVLGIAAIVIAAVSKLPRNSSQEVVPEGLGWNPHAGLNEGPLHPPVPYKAKEIVAEVWLNTLGGNSVSLAELQEQGKIIVLEFWRLDCPSCEEAVPMVNSLREKYGKRGVEFVTIHSGVSQAEKNVENIRRFVREKGIKAPVAVDYHRENPTNYILPMMLPTFLIVNKNGIVVNYLPTKDAREAIEKDLGDLLGGNDLEAVAKQRGKHLERFGNTGAVPQS